MKRIDLKKLQAHPGLLQVIFSDLRHYRGLVFWSFVAIVSALTTVYLTHLNRELLAEREQMMRQRDAIDVEFRHLVIEQTALSEHSRIETIAQRELGMRRPSDDQEVLVPWR
ncbi:cell division protein FtsL [Aliidiomarina sanyensis]|uniref:Cell division protein FtsL n=1 Tax=Aliidiomarina sanyensis TaxID=1249555 RepID=A0A432WIH1_9GAMM|nr:cell division protein FtsL [Aliidiomarina sanyensis]RUO33479.1 cell division protein FtsL [Aliidiomarina sanyensis]